MPPSAICGHDPTGTFPDGRLGCGQPIETCAEVYRCTDCTVPFHRQCADAHFGSAKNNYIDLAMRHEKAVADFAIERDCYRRALDDIREDAQILMPAATAAKLDGAVLGIHAVADNALNAYVVVAVDASPPLRPLADETTERK